MTSNIYTLLLCFDGILKHFALLVELKHNGMSLIKITLASQARSISQYKNLRIKVMKCCANIYFNKQCLIKTVIPNYAKIKIPYTSLAMEIIFIHCCVFKVILKLFILLLELKLNGISLIKIILCFLSRMIFRCAPCNVCDRISQLLFSFSNLSLCCFYTGVLVRVAARLHFFFRPVLTIFWAVGQGRM
jgi:hypothetical protein